MAKARSAGNQGPLWEYISILYLQYIPLTNKGIWMNPVSMGLKNLFSPWKLREMGSEYLLNNNLIYHTPSHKYLCPSLYSKYTQSCFKSPKVLSNHGIRWEDQDFMIYIKAGVASLDPEKLDLRKQIVIYHHSIHIQYTMVDQKTFWWTRNRSTYLINFILDFLTLNWQE